MATILSLFYFELSSKTFIDESRAYIMQSPDEPQWGGGDTGHVNRGGKKQKWNPFNRGNGNPNRGRGRGGGRSQGFHHGGSGIPRGTSTGLREGFDTPRGTPTNGRGQGFHHGSSNSTRGIPTGPRGQGFDGSSDPLGSTLTGPTGSWNGRQPAPKQFISRTSPVASQHDAPQLTQQSLDPSTTVAHPKGPLPDNHPYMMEMKELKTMRERRRIFWANISTAVGEEWENPLAYDRQMWESEERLADQKFSELSAQIALAERGFDIVGSLNIQSLTPKVQELTAPPESRNCSNPGSSQKMIWTERKKAEAVNKWMDEMVVDPEFVIEPAPPLNTNGNEDDVNGSDEDPDQDNWNEWMSMMNDVHTSVAEDNGPMIINDQEISTPLLKTTETTGVQDKCDSAWTFEEEAIFEEAERQREKQRMEMSLVALNDKIIHNETVERGERLSDTTIVQANRPSGDKQSKTKEHRSQSGVTSFYSKDTEPQSFDVQPNPDQPDPCPHAAVQVSVNEDKAKHPTAHNSSSRALQSTLGDSSDLATTSSTSTMSDSKNDSLHGIGTIRRSGGIATRSTMVPQQHIARTLREPARDTSSTSQLANKRSTQSSASGTSALATQSTSGFPLVAPATSPSKESRKVESARGRGRGRRHESLTVALEPSSNIRLNKSDERSESSSSRIPQALTSTQQRASGIPSLSVIDNTIRPGSASLQSFSRAAQGELNFERKVLKDLATVLQSMSGPSQNFSENSPSHPPQVTPNFERKVLQDLAVALQSVSTSQRVSGPSSSEILQDNSTSERKVLQNLAAALRFASISAQCSPETSLSQLRQNRSTFEHKDSAYSAAALHSASASAQSFSQPSSSQISQNRSTFERKGSINPATAFQSKSARVSRPSYSQIPQNALTSKRRVLEDIAAELKTVSTPPPRVQNRSTIIQKGSVNLALPFETAPFQRVLEVSSSQISQNTSIPQKRVRQLSSSPEAKNLSTFERNSFRTPASADQTTLTLNQHEAKVSARETQSTSSSQSVSLIPSKVIQKQSTAQPLAPNAKGIPMEENLRRRLTITPAQFELIDSEVADMIAPMTQRRLGISSTGAGPSALTVQGHVLVNSMGAARNSPFLSRPLPKPTTEYQAACQLAMVQRLERGQATETTAATNSTAPDLSGDGFADIDDVELVETVDLLWESEEDSSVDGNIPTARSSRSARRAYSSAQLIEALNVPHGCVESMSLRALQERREILERAWRRATRYQRAVSRGGTLGRERHRLVNRQGDLEDALEEVADWMEEGEGEKP